MTSSLLIKCDAVYAKRQRREKSTTEFSPFGVENHWFVLA